MQEKQMLPESQPVSGIQATVLKGTKVFEVNKLQFLNFDTLIKESSENLNIEYEVFFSNSTGTQHGYMLIVGGRVVKTVPLIEVNILDSHHVTLNDEKIGYLVKYCSMNGSNITEKYISNDRIKKNETVDELHLPKHGKKAIDDLCNRCLNALIYNKADEKEKSIIRIGKQQGLNFVSKEKVSFESREKYPEALYSVIPEGILEREKPTIKMHGAENIKECKTQFYYFFRNNLELKTAYLLRMASYTLTQAYRHGAEFDQTIDIITNDTVTPQVVSVICRNDKFIIADSLTCSSPIKEIDKRRTQRNDAVLLVVDETKADEAIKRSRMIGILESTVTAGTKNNHFIPVFISKYASEEIRSDLHCTLKMSNHNCNLSLNYLKYVLQIIDALYIYEIENNPTNFLKLYDDIFTEVSVNIPKSIPQKYKNTYIILVTALRVYDITRGPFFGNLVEDYIVNWLSDNNEYAQCGDDTILQKLGVNINNEIFTPDYHFIKRKKYIIVDKGTKTVIVDDDNLYVETSDIKSMFKAKMPEIQNMDYAVGILKKYNCLDINDKNSNCYRFHVQNSNGESYMLYTYGISKKLINAENRKRLDLTDYQRFLLDYLELEDNEILPLGLTADGHYVGKDVSYRNKSNDSMFITGQSGKGKSFCAKNLLPSLAMLGSRMLVCDVSDSFIRDEILRALPTDVVDALFEFIEVAAGKRKLPINPLFIGDCSGLPAKKRRIVGFIKAIAGKLNKEETRELTGIVSEMLKRYPKESSVTTDMIRNTLKRGGKTGHHVFSLISSTLDDIDTIGFEERGWAEFFEKSKKIPVISFGNESGDKVHSLLDALISSAFEWQRDHDSAPLSIVIDEIKDQNFAEESPLHTILTQGRKFHTRFIGMTQHYVSTTSHAIDVVKEAGIKIFFKPAKSLDRIASELGYKNPADAGFGSMGIGEFILSCDCYNKVDGVNEPIVIPCKAIKFIETPLFEKFKKEYGVK